MTLTGHVENGQIVLDDPISLADGVRVRLELISEQPDKVADSNTATDSEQSFYDRHKSWMGSVKDAPSDYAVNHDHYLHGQVKK